jgi:hypothetical protein
MVRPLCADLGTNQHPYTPKERMEVSPLPHAVESGERTPMWSHKTGRRQCLPPTFESHVKTPTIFQS